MVEAKPIVLVLDKKMTTADVDRTIKEVMGKLSDKTQPVSSIHFTCKQWEHDGRNIYDIPGAKALFAKTIERGMLGALLAFGHEDEAKSLYASAYLKRRKGKVDDGKVTFRGFNTGQYMVKVRESVEAFSALVDSMEEGDLKIYIED